MLACFITDPSGLLLRDRIGIDLISLGVRLPPHGYDLARVARVRLEGIPGCGLPRRRDPQNHVRRGHDGLRLGSVYAHAKEQATVGQCKYATPDVDVTRMSKDEWRVRNEAAGIGAI